MSTLSSHSAINHHPQEVQHTATPPLVDVTAALSPADAFRMLESTLSSWSSQLAAHGERFPMNAPVGIDCGALVLTPKLLQKMVVILRQYQCTLGMVYARLPQTQQAALGMGLLVKEAPDMQDVQSRSFTDFSHTQATDLEPQPHQHHQEEHKQYGSLPQPSQQEAVLTTEPAPLTANPITPILNDIIEGQLDSQRLSSPAANSNDYTALPTEELPIESGISSQPSKETRTAKLANALPHPATAITPASNLPTRMVMGSLRSGRTIASDGHLVIIGDVHGGSEVIAAGNIVIWGELRGVAHAGAIVANQQASQPEATQPKTPQSKTLQPNTLGEQATIRALAIHAVQLRLGQLIARRPDRLNNHKPDTQRLADGSVPPVTPEIARVIDREIRIYQALD